MPMGGGCSPPHGYPTDWESAISEKQVQTNDFDDHKIGHVIYRDITNIQSSRERIRTNAASCSLSSGKYRFNTVLRVEDAV